MDNKIIDGKLISEQIKKEIAAEVADMIVPMKSSPAFGSRHRGRGWR